LVWLLNTSIDRLTTAFTRLQADTAGQKNTQQNIDTHRQTETLVLCVLTVFVVDYFCTTEELLLNHERKESTHSLTALFAYIHNTSAQLVYTVAFTSRYTLENAGQKTNQKQTHYIN